MYSRKKSSFCNLCVRVPMISFHCAQVTGSIRAAGGMTVNRLRRVIMFEYLKAWLELKSDRRAVTMLEYAIMGSIIAGALVVAVPYLTNAVSAEFTGIAGHMTAP